MNNKRMISAVSIALFATLAAAKVSADTYEVTITNATRGETFTPRLHAAHSAGNFFIVGQPAIAEIATIAESGNVAPAMALLESAPEFVTGTAVGDGLLAPGATQTVMLEANPGDALTLIAMLIPTNDAFVAVDAVELPASGSISVNANVYDAGTEPNDELCANIPGPACGGEGDSPDIDGEGYVHIHSGIHGVGDLMAADYDWKNPAAKVTITRVP